MLLNSVVVGVSPHSCTITLTSPDHLDPTGGVLADGTENVMIECRCVDENGDVPQRIRWFDPKTARIPFQTNALLGDPYLIHSSYGKAATLVIPTFTYSTNGSYTCGINDYYPPYGNVTINLMLNTGKE